MNGDMSLDELYAHANEMCQRWWGVNYTGRIVLVNRYWKRAYGMFRYSIDNPSDCEIRMNRKVNAERSRQDVLETLLHELAHWRHTMIGAPSHDTDPEFIAECIRVGAQISDADNAQQAYERYIKGACA